MRHWLPRSWDWPSNVITDSLNKRIKLNRKKKTNNVSLAPDAALDIADRTTIWYKNPALSMLHLEGSTATTCDPLCLGATLPLCAQLVVAPGIYTENRPLPPSKNAM